MNSRKGLKYYAVIFFFSTVALILYIAYLSINAGSFDFDLVYSYLLVPPMFTLFLFVFDKIFEFIFPSKNKKEKNEYNIYLKQVGEEISNQCNFSIEGYRRLRVNGRFQKSLEQTFRIVTNGETDDLSFKFLEKKFKKNTDEYLALKVVIEEAKKMMVNS